MPKKRKAIDKFTESLEKKLDRMTVEDVIEFIVFGSTTFVVYNTIVGTQAAIDNIIDMFTKKPQSAEEYGFHFVWNIYWGVLQEFIPILPDIDYVEPEEVPVEVRQGLKAHVLGISVFISYLLIYRPEVVAALLGKAADVTSSLKSSILELASVATLIK